MQLIYTPQRSERKVSYALDGMTLNITENGNTKPVNLTELPDEHDYPIIEVTENSVTVIRFYGEDEKHIFENDD